MPVDLSGLIDLGAVTPEQLQTEHPTRLRWKAQWSNYRLLYVGGEEMLAAAGEHTAARADATPLALSNISALLTRDKRWRRFLYQLDGEPDSKYQNRWQRAVYLNYLAAILDFHRHWLYSQPPQMRPEDGKDAPEWFGEFAQNCNGGGQGLIDFMRDEFLQTMLYRYGGHLLGRESSDVGAVTDDNDGPRVVLTPYSAAEILDWQHDDRGELEWILLEKCRQVRAFPDERIEVRTITFVNRQQWGAWELIKGDAEKGIDDQVKLIDQGAHGLGRVPFVWHEIPEGLWITNKLAQWAINLFNQLSMLEYGALLSCFLQPARKRPKDGSSNEVVGEGNILNLWVHNQEGKLIEEDFKWISPDPAPLDFQQKRLGELKDEGYRIVHQMALAVDPQAASTTARSGVSKQEDRRSTEIILCGFGAYERAVIKRTLDLCSQIYGDNTKWVCAGFDSFNVSSLDEELQVAALAQTLNIKSRTFNAALEKAIATGRILNHLDEKVKLTISKEIDQAYDEMEEQKVSSIQLTPTDIANVVTVDEARATAGLGPLGDANGIKTVASFKAEAESAVEAAKFGNRRKGIESSAGDKAEDAAEGETPADEKTEDTDGEDAEEEIA